MSSSKAHRRSHRSGAADGDAAGTTRQAPAKSLNCRGALLIACAVVFAVFLFGWAGDGWMNVVYVLLTDGFIAAVWVVAAGLLGDAILPRERGCPQPHVVRAGTPALPPNRDTAEAVGHTGIGPLRLITAAALGLGLFGLAALGLGLAGRLNRATAVALPVVAVIVAVARAVQRRRSARSAPAPLGTAVSAWLGERAGWSWLWLIAMPFLAMAVVGAATPPVFLWNAAGDPHPYDVLEYHLQVPREWYEDGKITALNHNVFSYMPFNAEMQYLLAMHLRGGPWAGMYLAQMLNVATMGLAVAGIWAAARGSEFRVPSSELAASAGPSHIADHQSHISALAAVTVPWMTMLACIAYDEAALLLYGTLAMAWVVRALACRRSGLSMAVAGLMAGLACGTKYTAFPILLVVLPVVVVVGLVWWARVGLRRAVGVVGVYLVVAMVVLSPWLVRNWRWAGNPVFPEAMKVLGRGHFTPVQVERWERAHGAVEKQRPVLERAKALGREVGGDWRYGYVLWGMVLAAGVVGVARRVRGGARSAPYEDSRHSQQTPHPNPLPLSTRGEGEERPIAPYMLVALFVAMVVFWVFFTHLQSRFFVLGVPLAALLLGNLKWSRLAAGIAAGVIVGGAAVSLARLSAVLPANVPYGIPDFSAQGSHQKDAWLVSPGATTRPAAIADLCDGKDTLALIGDSKAFFYPVPMSRLRYRTVFDVNIPPGANEVEGWLGPAGDAGGVRIVFPSELRRFSETYWQIPPPPAWTREYGAPIIVKPAPR